MKILQKWFREYVLGTHTTPQQIYKAAMRDLVEQDPPSHSFARFLNNLPDSDKFEAPLRLKAPSLMTTSAMLRNHERADWQHVDARLRLFAAAFIEAARKRGIPLYVHGAFRTQEAQQALYDAGRTKTLWPRAAHCVGAAVDIVHGKFHWDMTPQEWQYLHKLGRDVERKINATLKVNQRLNLTWGGNWKFYDPAHWELHNWADLTPPNIQNIKEPLRASPRKMLKQFVPLWNEPTQLFLSQQKDLEG